jgi:hypothetical protein
MNFPFVFIIISMILMINSILHNKCICLWAFDFPMLMILVQSCVRDLINSSREGIFQVDPEVNLTEWNVDTVNVLNLHRIDLFGN